jgi:hypothetical protein
LPEHAAPISWEAALDLLEASLSATTLERWTPPPTAGPIPERLRARAERLLALQQEHIAALRAELADLDRQRGAVDRVQATAGSAVPRYLDVSA